MDMLSIPPALLLAHWSCLSYFWFFFYPIKWNFLWHEGMLSAETSPKELLALGGRPLTLTCRQVFQLRTWQDVQSSFREGIELHKDVSNTSSWHLTSLVLSWFNKTHTNMNRIGDILMSIKKNNTTVTKTPKNWEK